MGPPGEEPGTCTFSQIAELGGSGPPYSLAISPDGRRLALGNGRFDSLGTATVYLWAR